MKPAAKFPAFSAQARGASRVFPVLAALALAACAAPPPPAAVNDPLEQVNRAVHGVNVALDRAVISGLADGYAGVVPDPVERGVANFADTLDLPGVIANDLLQARPAEAGQNLLRLAVNLTMGVGGIFDAAGALGIPEAETDFGETLHVWGFGEGPYTVLPILGPSTLRDTVGTVVDIAANPVRTLVPDLPGEVTGTAKVLARLGDRARFGDTVDSILHDSADSYAQLRLLYLQNRRFELGQAAGADPADDPGFIDPYAE
jgi:phospholipid-binding lipoprotein MlaA